MRFADRLSEADSGVAFTEFAFTAPIVLGMGMMGTEVAYFTITHMQVSQIAMQVADNASRVGETDILAGRQVYEDDINAALVGAEKAGERINLFENGRVIVYQYEALTPFDWLDGEVMTYTAAFNVRDTRDLTGIFQTNPPTGVARCNVFSADRP